MILISRPVCNELHKKDYIVWTYNNNSPCTFLCTKPHKTFSKYFFYRLCFFFYMLIQADIYLSLYVRKKIVKFALVVLDKELALVNHVKNRWLYCMVLHVDVLKLYYNMYQTITVNNNKKSAVLLVSCPETQSC